MGMGIVTADRGRSAAGSFRSGRPGTGEHARFLYRGD